MNKLRIVKGETYYMIRTPENIKKYSRNWIVSPFFFTVRRRVRRGRDVSYMGLRITKNLNTEYSYWLSRKNLVKNFIVRKMSENEVLDLVKKVQATKMIKELEK